VFIYIYNKIEILCLQLRKIQNKQPNSNQTATKQQPNSNQTSNQTATKQQPNSTNMATSALPSRPRGFKIIVDGIPDWDAMSSVNIPTRWISQLLIDLGLGKIQVRGGMSPHSRYSKGCPRKYFMSIVVSFESTINEDLRTALESGNDIQLTYASKGDTATNKHGETYTIKKDKFITIKQYKPHVEAVRHATHAATKIHQSALHEKKKAKKQTSTTSRGNSFAALMNEE
tara:strand:+ start:767 stop:1453 length:687 start_codon:yes stop_codon:yes gene_type:complete